MRILIDTNILVRLASPRDPQYDDAFEAMRLVVEREHDSCIVPQVLYEFWVVATRPKLSNGLGLSVEQSLQDVRKFITDFEFLPDSGELFSSWFSLIEKKQIKGKPAHDARLVAAMLRHGVTHLLTFNAQDFARFSEIAAVAPADAASLPPVQG